MSLILPPVNTVVQADVLETLRSWPSDCISMAVADPAYGTKLRGVHWDQEPGYGEWITEVYRVLKPGGVCYTFGKPEIILRYLHLFPEPLRVMVWHYQNKTQPRARGWQSTWDAVVMFSKGEPRILRDSIREPYKPKYKRLLNTPRSAASGRFGKTLSTYVDRGGTLPRDVIICGALTGRGAKERTAHPTPKPGKLMRRLILSASLPGEIVADLFAGGGSTSASAARLGRKWVAVEREPTYCDIITARIAALPGGDVRTEIRVDSSQASKSYSNPEQANK